MRLEPAVPAPVGSKGLDRGRPDIVPGRNANMWSPKRRSHSALGGC